MVDAKGSVSVDSGVHHCCLALFSWCIITTYILPTLRFNNVKLGCFFKVFLIRTTYCMLGSSARQFSLKFHVILKYICQVHNDILAFPLSSTDVETRSGEMVITLAPEIIVMGLFFTSRSCKHCWVDGIW